MTFTFFVCFLICCSLARARCPIKFRDNQASCRPGKAISSIWWNALSPSCKNVSIACVNATDSCTENCTWSDRCLTHARTISDYVRGIHVMYDNIKDDQKVLFLCCRSGASKRDKCNGKLKDLHGKKESNSSYIMKQAQAIYHKNGTLTLRGEICASSRTSTTLCPLTNTRWTIITDPALTGLPELAGLSGLAGLALIHKKEEKDSCCCPGFPAFNTLKCVPGCSICNPSDNRNCVGALGSHYTCKSNGFCGCVLTG